MQKGTGALLDTEALLPVLASDGGQVVGKLAVTTGAKALHEETAGTRLHWLLALLQRRGCKEYKNKIIKQNFSKISKHSLLSMVLSMVRLLVLNLRSNMYC